MHFILSTLWVAVSRVLMNTSCWFVAAISFCLDLVLFCGLWSQLEEHGLFCWLLPWFTAAADAKSYIIVSQLPDDIYKKFVENKNKSHVTGFTFVVIGIIHLAGGKITEGTISIWDVLLFLFFRKFFGVGLFV